MKADDKSQQDEKPRSIRLSADIWQVVDEDARRCRRSAVKQIEAILVRYYDLEPSIELDEIKLARTAEVVSRPRKKA